MELKNKLKKILRRIEKDCIKDITLNCFDYKLTPEEIEELLRKIDEK